MAFAAQKSAYSLRFAYDVQKASISRSQGICTAFLVETAKLKKTAELCPSTRQNALNRVTMRHG
jgi:hypothetical protein